MYNCKIFAKFHFKYCLAGYQERNEKVLFKKIKIFKLKNYTYLLNLYFENFALFFIRIHIKRKRIAKYAEIIPRLLRKRQRIIKTISFLKKYWKLFTFERHILKKQREILYKMVYKNQLNFKRWD
jgi:hypothetical protein